MDKLIPNSPHSFLLRRRYSRIARRRRNRQRGLRRWGEVSRRVACSSRHAFRSFGPGLPGPVRDPRGGLPVSAAAAFGRTTLRELPRHARRLVPTQLFALARRSPRWAAHRAEILHRVAAVGPGGCCGSPGTTERRQGPPRACAGRCASGESPQVAIRVHVQRRRRRQRALQRVRPPAPLTPLALSPGAFPSPFHDPLR
jgi:hypothetical protein